MGSKISLVSKSEIRYEGTLFTLNPNESTLALAKGKKLLTNYSRWLIKHVFGPCIILVSLASDITKLT